MTHISYYFEELEPFPGQAVLVAGTAEIIGEWDSADPSVGIMVGGFDYTVEQIFLESLKPGEEPVEIKEDHPLYKLIEAQLYSDRYGDYIREELEEKAIPDPDYYDDRD